MTKKRPAQPKREREPALAITDLIDKATLQAFQDQFSDKYRIPTAILDHNGEPITFERGHSSYCQEIRQTQAGSDHCRECDRRMVGTVVRTGRPSWRVCQHGNLLDFAVPLRVSGKVTAFFCIGQLRGQRGRKATDRLSASLEVLHAVARKTGEESKICDDSLKRKYARIPQRRKGQIDAIEAAAIEFAKDLSSALGKLEKWRRPQAAAAFVGRLFRAADLDALLDLCVREIPRLLGTSHCSVFTVESGPTRASARLVLRRTSYRPSKNLEGRGCYRIGQGLTGWVWENRRPLRLNNIQDAKQVGEYGGLKWSQHIDDSDHHREWLGVPLFGRKGGVIGVIRVPEKKRSTKRHGGGFSFQDEILLMLIGQQVARQIEDLRIRGLVDKAMRACSQCAVELARPADSRAVATAILGGCRAIWGSTGKSYFFNLLHDDGTLRIERVLGSLARDRLEGNPIPYTSLSGQCLLRRRPVTIHEFDRGPTAREDIPSAGGIEASVAAPIRFGKRFFGTLSVGGPRRYEFSEEPDLRILQDLAALAGAALERLEAQREGERAFSQYSRRVGHALMSRILVLEATTAALRARIGTKEAAAIEPLDEAVEFLKSAADLALRFGRAWEPTELVEFELAPIADRLEKLYSDPRLKVDVGPRVRMVGDPQLIEQVLVELIENARRFAPKIDGKIKLRVFRPHRRATTKEAARAVVIEVRDNGQGVRKDDKESIFDPYQTSDDAHLGLGLSFVRRVVEAHDGQVEECGRPGSGACFRVVLPQPKGETGAQEIG